MASKVMVSLPVAAFGQVNKSKSGTVSSDIVMTRPNQDVSQRNTEITRNCDSSRVAQLEQNIKFLQEQHALMLNGLHNEIESLKIRNRELQFQLIFANKGSTPVSSPSSSSEDDSKYKVYSSPQPLNDTPLQVEILERELGELKLQLQEAEKRNVYFSSIVDEQKKKIESYERSKDADPSPVQPDSDLARRLDDAEALIRRLRRENSDIKRDHNSYNNGRDRGENGYQGGSRGSGRGNRGGGEGQDRRHKGGGGNGHYRTNWFPPLHTQSYWQHGGGRSSRSPNGNGGGGGGGGNPSGDHHQRRGSANGSGCAEEPPVAITGAALPALNAGAGDRRASNNNHHHPHPHHQQHYSNGGGKYHRGGGGGQKQKHT
ncbi:unnamed protein product [Callosobruchus maculatus]|uniref:CCDC92/74 N-terminal domain-containing protein n=1 Tax=Callosobruchus maculatus TaxID=64391 RepID=A0A653BKV3_CALMS|nr:unnamed protein product [Callosobruchus maculatus]